MMIEGVAYEVDVRGSGPPLLLLHGFTGTARSWDVLTEGLVQSHRVIAPDLLGHGRSHAPADPARYGLGRQAADLAALLRRLDAIPADVLGYSMGARLAAWLAIDTPEAIERLVLESPSAGIVDADARRARRRADEGRAAMLEAKGLEAFIDAWEAEPLFASHAGLSEAARARLRAERLSHDPRGLAASLRGAGQGAMQPIHDPLDRIDAATLVVAGELDRVGAARAREVATGIPGARWELVPGAGHAPHLEQPGVFEALLADFLTSSAATPTH